MEGADSKKEEQEEKSDMVGGMIMGIKKDLVERDDKEKKEVERIAEG